MEPKEQEKAIGELEERVDRLRTLYEQYFLGFEKLLPEVPRKDVDRRFAILRKEQIRNTALRYRFNVVTQKFNTYAMYWQRICRQIEEGTFKRHVQRAKKILGEREMKHLSIDVDLADFDSEDFDMDALLREADAAAEAMANEAPDTVPPPPPSHRGGAPPKLGTPGTSFAIGGRREVVDDVFPPERESQPGLMRAARPAALPTGSKPKVLRKIGAPGSEPPASQPTNPSTNPGTNPGRQPAASSPRVAVPAAPQSSPRVPVPAAPHSEALRAVGPASPGPQATPRVAVPAAPQSSPRVAVPAAPQSSPRVAVPAPPGAMRASAPSTPEIRPSGGRIPVANPRPPPPSSPEARPSAGRMPVANPPMPGARPSGGKMPVANPPMRPPAASSPSIDARGSAGRIAVPKPPPSGRLPATPPSDDEERPRPSVKPPPPLPSHHARPKKPE